MQEYIEAQGGSTNCPVTGCSAKVTAADIEPNEDLKRRVEAFAARQARDKENNSGTQKGKSATQYEIMSDDDDED